MSDIKAKKQFGQNFLTDNRIPERIVAMSGITPKHGVIEIGPGRGILTAEITKVAAKTVAVEIDSELIPVLNEKFSDNPNVIIKYGDILEENISELIAENFTSDMPISVCANIPYYITSPIIVKFITSGIKLNTLTFMVQKEFASRLCAKKGSEDFSSLTVFCSYYADVKRLFAVPAGCFTPKPKVDSAVIRFDMLEKPRVVPKDEKLLFDLIRVAFSYRRKTFVNCLNSAYPNITKEAATELLQQLGYQPTVRGEEFDIFDLQKISDALTELL